MLLLSITVQCCVSSAMSRLSK